jgi:hypothetical protein
MGLSRAIMFEVRMPQAIVAGEKVLNLGRFSASALVFGGDCHRLPQSSLAIGTEFCVIHDADSSLKCDSLVPHQEQHPLVGGNASDSNDASTTV